MAVSLTRWFGRTQAEAGADKRRYRPQRELLHRMTLSLIRCGDDLDATLPDLLRQGAVASGFSLPLWLAWRTDHQSTWHLNGTNDAASALEVSRLGYQLDLATRGDRTRLQTRETLADLSVQGIRMPDGESGLQLWLLAPTPDADKADHWRQVLCDLGQAIREGLDLNLAHSNQLRQQRQSLQQSLAATLHDSVAQQLCYLCLQTGRLEQQVEQLPNEEMRDRLHGLRQQARQAYRQTRELISSSRIRLHHSLEKELQTAIAEFERHSGLMFELDNRLCDRNLPEAIAVELLLILREALSNAVRHAHAQKVRIQLLPHGEKGIHIRIEDDGQGLPSERNADSFGLGIMEERAKRIGAHFHIESRAGQGTCIELITEELCL
ncbi:sensor histidine kinase [Marinobacterium stanieri]|uniref:sensor histidine kinase n=1 Tax=Marinobacterium stanieri TaxID=49186 RepID=UPI003A8E5768